MRNKILNFKEDTDEIEFAIRLIIDIQYDEKDSLENISDFILDLDPDIKTAKILFECSIRKTKFLESDGFEFQIYKSFFKKKNWFLMIHLKRPELIYPQNATNESTLNWQQIHFK